MNRAEDDDIGGYGVMGPGDLNGDGLADLAFTGDPQRRWRPRARRVPLRRLRDAVAAVSPNRWIRPYGRRSWLGPAVDRAKTPRRKGRDLRG